MFVNFGEKEAMHSLRIISSLREKGISAELFPSSDKMKKQMGYANSHGIPYVAIIGEQEMTDGTTTVKNMTTGEQNSMVAETLSELLIK
jgi:histidyl-tRNA synthetase